MGVYTYRLKPGERGGFHVAILCDGVKVAGWFESGEDSRWFRRRSPKEVAVDAAETYIKERVR